MRGAALKRALVGSALAGCTLAGCAASPPPLPVEDPPLTYRVAPQPPGSELDPPGIPPEANFTGGDGSWEWPGSLPPGSEEDREGPHMQRIRDRGRIIVGVDQSQYLLSYREPTQGDLRGFEVDLAREVAKDIFAPDDATADELKAAAAKVDFRFVEPSARAETLRAGDVDIVIRTMTITPERAELVDFSSPYLTSHVRVLAPRDRGIAGVDDLRDRTICVVDGTNLVNLVRAEMPESHVLRTRSWSDCLMATQQFQADAVVGDDAVLAGMVAQDPLAQIFSDPLAEQLYAVGVPKGHDDLVRQVNYTIERVSRDGTWSRLYRQWLGNSLSDAWLPRRMYRDVSAEATSEAPTESTTESETETATEEAS